MILFCGVPTEPPLLMAIEAADAANLSYAIFNQREAHYADIVLDQHQGRWGGTLWCQERAWPLDAFTGVYTRLLDHSILPYNEPQGRLPPDAQTFAHSQFLHATLNEWIEMTPCRVLNRAEAMASNGSKPYQAQFIVRTGFLTPTTLVTNDPDQALAFARQHKHVVYKSTSSIRSIVRDFDPQQTRGLEQIRSLPTQFQARVMGTNIRVHVVGQQLFATEIVSQAVDYRYAQRDGLEVEMRPVELPTDVAARCLKLSEALLLPFCGIDLMRTPDDEYYCFEVNPSPAYSYFEQEAGQPIARAVVDYLSLAAH